MRYTFVTFAFVFCCVRTITSAVNKCYGGRTGAGVPIISTSCGQTVTSCVAYTLQGATHYACVPKDVNCALYFKSTGATNVKCCQVDNCNNPNDGKEVVSSAEPDTGHGIRSSPEPTSGMTTAPGGNISCYGGSTGSNVPIIPTFCTQGVTCARYSLKGQTVYTCLQKDVAGCTSYLEGMGAYKVLCCKTKNCNRPKDSGSIVHLGSGISVLFISLIVHIHCYVT